MGFNGDLMGSNGITGIYHLVNDCSIIDPLKLSGNCEHRLPVAGTSPYFQWKNFSK